MEEQLTKKQRRELKKQLKQEQIEKIQKRKQTKRFISWLGVILGILLIISALISKSEDNPNEIIGSMSEITQTDHIKGDPNADIVIIEYSDFQCPACNSYSLVIDELLQDYGCLLYTSPSPRDPE